MNTIQQELEAAKGKMIEEVSYRDCYLAKLTRDNVAIVEAMIRNDSAYIRSTDTKAVPVISKNGKIKYGGSSAFWMTRLKEYLNYQDNGNYTYKDIIAGAVESVDRENSTHLNSDRCGRREIEKRLIEFDRIELLKCLKEPEYQNFKLIREISRKTSAPKRSRNNLSFASKFCHYACFYLFEGTEWQDNYSIWDSILRKVLPLYLGYYQITDDYDLYDYAEYRIAVDAVRKASGIAISRNGFDHLLWYYHKGRL